MKRLAAALVLIAFPAAAEPDPAAGERLFKAQCGACHTIEAGKHRVGPSLAGIFGRKAGEIEGFRYSPANKNSGLIWDAVTLDPYLANPRAIIPGTTMTYAGLRNPAQRADMIAYLQTLK